MRESNGVSVQILSATITAADLVARTGIAADATWAAGDTYGAFGAIRKTHGLALETKLAPSSTLDEHVRDMLRRLAPSAQKIGQLAAQVEVIFACKIESKRAPILHFDSDTLRWLAAMNAKLDIDTAVISEPPKPASGGAAGGAAGAKPSGF